MSYAGHKNTHSMLSLHVDSSEDFVASGNISFNFSFIYFEFHYIPGVPKKSIRIWSTLAIRIWRESIRNDFQNIP